jgi:acyl-CoA synthetase (AMP-forming)/AMP-acid ligase II
MAVIDPSCGGLLGQRHHHDRCLRDDRLSWLTLGDVQDAVHGLAAQLSKARDGLVFLFASNEVPTVIGLLAAWSLRMPVALLDPNGSQDAVERLVRTYEPEVVLNGPAPILGTYGYQALPDDNGGHAPRVYFARPPLRAAINPELALMLSTSGSTGSPKFVRLSRSAVRTNARQIAGALSIEPSDVGIAHLPLHYSYGLSVLTSHLAVGAAVSLTGARVTDALLWQRVREDSGTHFPGVPFHYGVLDRLGIDRLVPPSVRSFTQAGGHLDLSRRARCYDAIVRRGGRFYIMYGQTEAGPRITTLQSTDFPNHSATVGKVLKEGKLLIVDDVGKPQPPGLEGNVIYEGPNVMMGYALARDDLARGDEQQGRLETGDRGVLSNDGFLTLTGRTQRFAKVAGLRIGLDEIETFLAPGCVVAIAPQDHIILCVTEPAQAAVAARLPELVLRLRLPSHVFSVRSIETIPLKVTGKIDYKALECLT